MANPKPRHQHNAWACGPTALHNALLHYRCKVDPRELERACYIDDDCEPNQEARGGYCEHGLRQAAKMLGFLFDYYTAETPTQCYRLMQDVGVPLLICVEHNSHWVTITRVSPFYVWLCEPARNVELVQRVSWKTMARRLVYGLPGETRFDFYHLRKIERPYEVEFS